MIIAFPSSGQAIQFIKRIISGGASPAGITFVGDLNNSFGELADLLDNCATMTLSEQRTLLVAGALASKTPLVTKDRFAGLFMNYELIPRERDKIIQWIKRGNSLVIADDENDGKEENIQVNDPTALWAWPEQAIEKCP